MSILKKFAILFLICILCDAVVSFLPFSFPGNVLSMVVLFICLFFGLIKVRHIESASDFMLKNMAFFFIPVTASIVSYADVLIFSYGYLSINGVPKLTNSSTLK